MFPNSEDNDLLARTIVGVMMGALPTINGNLITIDNGDSYSTLYAHCSAMYVSLNQRVQRGQVIGAVGATGYATGPHLHFEIRKNGVPIDPLGKL